MLTPYDQDDDQQQPYLHHLAAIMLPNLEGEHDERLHQPAADKHRHDDDDQPAAALTTGRAD